MRDDDRLMRLEETAAQQERVIEELSGQIAEQWKTIEALRARLDALTERFIAVEEQTLEAPPITRPPHY